MSEDRYDRASGINAQFTEREKTVKMGREPVADNARLRSGTPTADDLWTALADLLSANADGKDAEVYWSALQRARDVRDRYRRTIEAAAPVSKRVERLETALSEIAATTPAPLSEADVAPAMFAKLNAAIKTARQAL